ncbi:MAG: hypothetical protein VW707_10495, partial [Candidatus Puniceispirillum sp.]
MDLQHLAGNELAGVYNNAGSVGRRCRAGIAQTPQIKIDDNQTGKGARTRCHGTIKAAAAHGGKAV